MIVVRFFTHFRKKNCLVRTVRDCTDYVPCRTLMRGQGRGGAEGGAMSFGKRLREVREGAGATQGQLAQRAGVTLATLRGDGPGEARARPAVRRAARPAGVPAG